MPKKEKAKPDKFQKWFKKLFLFEKLVYRPFFPYKRLFTTEFEDRNYIVVGNHLSLFDIVFAARTLDKPIHFIAKSELFEKGLMKKFVLKTQCIPVSRDGSDLKAVMQSMKYLKNGESIAIFPEGRRNYTNEKLLPFKGGAAVLSIKTKTPIIPFVQVKKIRFLRRSYALYGEPIEFAEYYDRKLTEKDIQDCDEKLRNIMLELYDKLSDMLKKKKR